MKSLTSYLLVMFMVMFWVFRLVVTFTASMGMEFAIKPLDMNFEIILLFVTLLATILVIKRSIIGASLYLLSYGAYFGVDVYQTVMRIVEGATGLKDYTAFLISFVAIILAIATFFDVLITRTGKQDGKDKKTDWFYKNEQFDREMDDRADTNNYRIG